MMNNDIETIKKHHRQNLARLPFDLKIAMLINMQKIAREMALSAGRPFKGTVWCETPPVQSEKVIEAPDLSGGKRT
jgi:hypothetical protein